MTYEESVASLLLKKDKHIEELNSALKKGQTEHIIIIVIVYIRIAWSNPERTLKQIRAPNNQIPEQPFKK